MGGELHIFKEALLQEYKYLNQECEIGSLSWNFEDNRIAIMKLGYALFTVCVYCVMCILVNI